MSKKNLEVLVTEPIVPRGTTWIVGVGVAHGLAKIGILLEANRCLSNNWRRSRLIVGKLTCILAILPKERYELFHVEQSGDDISVRLTYYPYKTPQSAYTRALEAQFGWSCA